MNIDTRDFYSRERGSNAKRLDKEFVANDYDTPLWGTVPQFEKYGLSIKDGEVPVKLSMSPKGDYNEGCYYAVYNFSQTTKSEGLYWTV